MSGSYFLYILNTLLASAVVGLCFVKAHWTLKSKNARDIRVAGLGLISVGLVWSSLSRRHQDLKPWHFVIAVGLALCVYGMAKIAKGEIEDHE